MEEHDNVGSGNTGRHPQEATDGKAVEPEQSGCMRVRQMILIEMGNWFRAGVADTASRADVQLGEFTRCQGCFASKKTNFNEKRKDGCGGCRRRRTLLSRVGNFGRCIREKEGTTRMLNLRGKTADESFL